MMLRIGKKPYSDSFPPLPKIGKCKVYSKNILVVDDLPDWRTTLSGILFTEGYQVYITTSRTEVLQAIGKRTIQLAILDVRLDERDEDNCEGLELLLHIPIKFSI